jgi:hypothetical protein
VEANAAISLIYVAYLSERLGLKGIFRKMVSPLLTNGSIPAVQPNHLRRKSTEETAKAGDKFDQGENRVKNDFG